MASVEEVDDLKPRLRTKDGTRHLNRTWRIGDVTITKIVESEVVVDLRAALPQADRARMLALPWLQPHFLTPEGLAIMSFHALVVDAPGKRILVDTCMGNHKDLSIISPIFSQLQGPFLEDLAAAGYPRESIDVVLCTHLHFDHIGWNTMLVDGEWVPTFPKARYLVSADEHHHSLELMTETNGGQDATPWIAMELDAFVQSIQPIERAGLLELVGGEHRICDEVSLTPTPGHSPGHVSVVIRSRGEEAVITGDATHHPAQLAHPDWGAGVDFDIEAAAKTRAELFARCSEKPVLVIGTHWAGVTAGHVEREGPAYRLRA
jgi:glyoxylase-like metal-dependent hydrolase (beta-lactamase superfamily II)